MISVGKVRLFLETVSESNTLCFFDFALSNGSQLFNRVEFRGVRRKIDAPTAPSS